MGIWSFVGLAIFDDSLIIAFKAIAFKDININKKTTLFGKMSHVLQVEIPHHLFKYIFIYL